MIKKIKRLKQYTRKITSTIGETFVSIMFKADAGFKNFQLRYNKI